jgi:hypothetical protein
MYLNNLLIEELCQIMNFAEVGGGLYFFPFYLEIMHFS